MKAERRSRLFEYTFEYLGSGTSILSQQSSRKFATQAVEAKRKTKNNPFQCILFSKRKRKKIDFLFFGFIASGPASNINFTAL